ncbi:hypothetical protein GCM10023258_39940 [Terrabacter aeriphilus]|uniref:Uncharacterized protein n=1 Tax=Terrabacter aeriphilus TaxID=515662 RepID=A0ABP9JMR1_9MICO
MTIRPVAELDATLADVNDELSYAPQSADFYRGCAAALEWITGQRRVGPVDVDGSATADESGVHGQLAAAVAMLHGERPTPAPLVRAYVSGVEATLAWVLGQTDEPPL